MRRSLVPSVVLTSHLLLAGCEGSPQMPVVKPATGFGNDVLLVMYDPQDTTIALRIDAPPGFVRTKEEPTSFPTYLRELPLKPFAATVRLHTGRSKSNQGAHAAVIDVSVGERDLQQCADAVMRLRAEYLYEAGRQDEIAFNFTSGFRAEWKRWRKGERIKVEGNACRWVPGRTADASHAELLRFLDMVFTYAGTLSLQRELRPAPTDLRIGDVFIQGGSPGHAVIVVDMARHADGRTAFLIAQSYMPAQDIHVLKNAEHPELGAWYILSADDRLYTPEWTFDWGDRRRWP